MLRLDLDQSQGVERKIELKEIRWKAGNKLGGCY